MINIYQPSLGKEELEAIKEVFESNWIGKGPKTSEFERRFAETINVDSDHIKSITSCTEGMFQVLSHLSFKKYGDEVILPTISFVGAANAIINNNGVPVFCDVDYRTLNPTVKHIEAVYTPRTKAVLLIHYSGLPCEMDEIIQFCKEKKLFLIEDNACSPFSKYKSRYTGTLGDFGIWSFDAMKILVTGDGGMIYSKSKEYSKQIEKKCYLGLDSESGFTNVTNRKWWEFELSYPGRRSITNDITSAIGLVQLQKVKSFIARRNVIHHTYNQELRDLDWCMTPPEFPGYIESSYYMYWLQMENDEIRTNLASYLKENDIYTTFRYYPLHLTYYYNDGSYYNLVNAEQAAENTLCIPLHQSLTNENVNYIIETIRKFKV